MGEIEELTEQETIVSTSKPKPVQVTRTKPQPRYAVIVLDDDLHTFDYVIETLCRVCGHTVQSAFQLAVEIDTKGLAPVWSGSMEVAELKRDQILGFGPDMYAKQTVTFPLGCYIEPVA